MSPAGGVSCTRTSCWQDPGTAPGTPPEARTRWEQLDLRGHAAQTLTSQVITSSEWLPPPPPTSDGGTSGAVGGRQARPCLRVGTSN